MDAGYFGDFPVQVQQDAQRGRFLVATRDLEAGTVVLRTRPYAFAPLDSHRKRVCTYCMSRHESGRYSIGCSKCDQVYYCSAECRSNDKHHEQLCGIFRKIATHAADRHVKSLLRVLVLVLFNLHYFTDELPTELQVLPRGDFTEFLLLQSHVESWTKEEVQDWHKSEKLLSGLLENAKLLDHGEQLLAFVSAIESNCFGVWTNKGETCGRALYLRASYFNHSCRPNCESYQDSGIMTISTAQFVPSGTELTIKYIDVDVPLSSRRDSLKNDYHFLCCCPRCLEEDTKAASYTYSRSVNRSLKNRPAHQRHKSKRPANDSLDSLDSMIEKLTIDDVNITL